MGVGIMDIDQTTGLGYLADKTNKSVVVFDTKTDKFVARIAGFVGQLKDGNARDRMVLSSSFKVPKSG